MLSASVNGVTIERAALSPRLVRAGVLTAIVDGLFSSVLSVFFYNSSVTRLFQGVASTILGKSAIDGGPTPALIGIIMHVCVAFGWSTVFLLLTLRSARIRRLLAEPYGVLRVACVYGPCVWLVMSLIVIPLLVRRPPTINFRWWVQLIGQAPFVGLPIVASIAGSWRSWTSDS
jgi:hypothetical protein